MSICSSFYITIALTIIIGQIYLWPTYQIGYICDILGDLCACAANILKMYIVLFTN
jgi:predicted anti-sigma-YlaC factor YlaD